MVLYRFTAAGQPDNAFDGNGHLAILSGTRTEGANWRSPVTWSARNVPEVALGVDQPVIARSLGSGTPDATFGASGVQPLALQGTSNYGVSIALPPTNPARISIGVDSYDLAGNVDPMMATTSMTGVLVRRTTASGRLHRRHGRQLRDAAVGSTVPVVLVSANFAGDVLSHGRSAGREPGHLLRRQWLHRPARRPSSPLAVRYPSPPTGGIFVGGNMVGVAQMGIVSNSTAPQCRTHRRHRPQHRSSRGLTVKKASLNVSIAAQAEGLTTTAGR